MKPVYRCVKCGAYTENPNHCGSPAMLVLDPHSRERLSKLMSGLLRHFPEAAGLRLRRDGFVKIGELAKAIKGWQKSDYSWVTEEHVLAVALTDPKGRFEVRDGMIRARYGHSIDVSITYEPVVVDGHLYHGTVEEKLASIMRVGLKPMKRRMVHLTSSLSDAWSRARARRGSPVVLVVDAARLSRELVLYKAGRTVYVAPRVPPKYIVRVLRPGAAEAEVYSDLSGFNEH